VVETALEYDADLPEAWLLAMALRFWATNYVGALEAAQIYQKLKPEDQEAEPLVAVCKRAAKKGLKAVDLSALAELFTRKGLFSLAVDYTLMSNSTIKKQHVALNLYQAMIEKAWPGCGNSLKATDRGLEFDIYRKQDCVITNLNPLAGIPLMQLSLFKQPITDLTPLQGMPLTGLSLTKCAVTNLGPIIGMPLQRLDIRDCRITDLSPVKGMSLTWVWLNFSSVKDISPLKGMPIRNLGLATTKVADLAPLEGMPLLELTFTPKNITNGIPVVRAINTITKIGIDADHFMSPAEFWKKYDAGEFK
jgi:hypothetical protein